MSALALARATELARKAATAARGVASRVSSALATMKQRLLGPGLPDNVVRDVILGAAKRAGIDLKNLGDLPGLLRSNPGVRESLLEKIDEEIKGRFPGSRLDNVAVFKRGLTLGKYLNRMRLSLSISGFDVEHSQALASFFDKVAAEVGVKNPLKFATHYNINPNFRALAQRAFMAKLPELGDKNLTSALLRYQAEGGDPLHLLMRAKMFHMSHAESLRSHLGHAGLLAGMTAPHVARHGVRLAVAPLLEMLNMIPGFRNVAAHLQNGVSLPRVFVSGISENLRTYGPRVFGELGKEES